jgi:hypothetical protein
VAPKKKVAYRSLKDGGDRAQTWLWLSGLISFPQLFQDSFLRRTQSMERQPVPTSSRLFGSGVVRSIASKLSSSIPSAHAKSPEAFNTAKSVVPSDSTKVREEMGPV